MKNAKQGKRNVSPSCAPTTGVCRELPFHFLTLLLSNRVSPSLLLSLSNRYIVSHVQQGSWNWEMKGRSKGDTPRIAIKEVLWVMGDTNLGFN